MDTEGVENVQTTQYSSRSTVWMWYWATESAVLELIGKVGRKDA